MPRCSIDEKEVRNLYIKDGLTQQAIANRLGVSRATVSKIIIGMGLSCKDRRNGLTIDGVRWTIKSDKGDTLVLKKVLAKGE